MSASASQPSVDPAPSAGAYTPGHVRQKVAMIVIGLLVAAVGLGQLWRPLRLTFLGATTSAEAIRVVRITPGEPDKILTTEKDLQSETDRHARDSIFWNEFQFETPAGRVVMVRANVGSQGKPLLPLISPDGLPTFARVSYDPAHPENAIFPLLMSTWLAPGMITLCGLLTVLISSVLLYWANRPIEVPHVGAPADK